MLHPACVQLSWARGLRQRHPNQSKLQIEKGSTAGRAASSTDPPGSNIVVVDGLSAEDFTDVTSLLVDSGVEPLVATRYVCVLLVRLQHRIPFGSCMGEVA